eukprot:CAMPEP_0172518744 /NCGR_PEP_ID=MMETSP1066-20121228/290998_1 /TAXON_ID=671091 /ORGANISM="Coscinodiscus wailesii, Strain CCMP2513" /LENGTH=376 /DNA_ID=CAMNT_0013301187 /DNA_START=75 /DNA_END=1205 /DNA_ORIENTATION=+
MSSGLLDVGVATIFAREFLEAFIITGNYRTVIQKNERYTDEERNIRLKAVTKWALIASFVAILVVLAVAIPLGMLSQQLDKAVVEIIEGVSKVIAAVCILQFSVKIPVWLGVYEKVPLLPWRKTAVCILQFSVKIPVWLGVYEKVPLRPWRKKSPTVANDELDDKEGDVTLSEIRFNVSWNIWREIAECGVFLIPYFLGGNPTLIPLSALLGTAIAIVVGGLIYFANHKLENKVWLAVFMALVTGFLSIGLFVGGCHEFEEVWGETPKVWKIQNPNLSHKKLPMVILKPFGYSASRTILQMACFWSWTFLFVLLHGLKYRATKIYRKEKADLEAKFGKGDIEMANDSTRSDNTSSGPETPVKDGPKGTHIPLPDVN